MALDVKTPKNYRKAWNGSPRPSTRAELVARLTRYLAQSTMTHTERYESNAERFYQETGYVAPGKSMPLEMHGYTDEDRGVAWDEWNRLNLEQWQRDLRDVITALESDHWSQIKKVSR